jgi:hypothetical protein
MGRHETIIPTEPPRAPAVLKHLEICKRTLAALEREVPGLLLAVAEGVPGSKEGLTALREKIAAVEFEIAHCAAARMHAETLDREALVSYRAAIQTLSPEEIIDGITKESCCRRCPEAGRCVISAADIMAGACCHPVKERHLFPLDATGKRIFRHRDNPQASRVFDAACDKLNVRREFA